MQQGIVISDLHLYTKRSWADASMGDLLTRFQGADQLVLNGDIFDFRWTTLPTIEHTINKAENWLTSLIDKYPTLDIHYILGNHDCHHAFIRRIASLADKIRTFTWHEYYYRTGHHLFLHGDCTNFKMTFEKHKKIRNTWRNIKKRPSYQSSFYTLFDKLGGTKLFYRLYFQNHIVAKRILHYLNTLPSGFPENIKHIYTGHSHLPMDRYQWKNYYFYNTGSTIKGMPFNMIYFR